MPSVKPKHLLPTVNAAAAPKPLAPYPRISPVNEVSARICGTALPLRNTSLTWVSNATQRTAGCERAKSSKAACVEQRHGYIVYGELRRGAGRGRKIQRAGFLGNMVSSVMRACFGQRGSVAGHAATSATPSDSRPEESQ
jgi:hypothetical protein